MEQDHSSAWGDPKRLWQGVLAALLGADTALFIYGYWLTDLALPDEQLLAATLLLGIVAAAACFVLLTTLRKKWSNPGVRTRWWLALLSAPIAAFLLLGGTSNWRSPERYLTFLLPSHRLQLSVSAPVSAPATNLVWFNTSLGDVSYDSIQASGWKRVGDKLVLEDRASNALSWSGKVGGKVLLVFSGASPDASIQISWDGEAEALPLSKDKVAYSRAFAVPVYASDATIILLGFLDIYLLTLACVLIVWENRAKLADGLQQTMDRPVGSFNRRDVALLVGTAVVALLLRVFGLGNLFPAVDEYYHLNAAKQIVQGAALSSVYPRGLWLVTLPISAALRILGFQIWAARLVGVIFNVLAIVPLYLLTRKINRPVAVVTCLLYATSPWIITFGRLAREYAYYPFYFYWVIYGMVLFREAIPLGFVFLRDWKALIRPKLLVLGGALLIPPYFGLVVDWLSTFRTILIAYLVFGLFILLRFDWKAKSNWPFLAVLGAGVAVSGRSWYGEQSDKMFTLPQLNTLPLSYFLPNPQQQWYFNRVVVVAALGILAVVAASLMVRRINIVPLFMLALFSSYLAVFALLSKTFFHTRHLLSTDLWYVVVVGIGLFVVWETIRLVAPPIGTRGGLLLAGVLGLSVLNVQQILLPTISTNPDMPISEDYMHDLSQVQSYMLGHVRSGDILISTVYGQYATWEGNPAFDAQYHITSQTPRDQILGIVAQHPSGWLVVDEIRFKLGSMSIRDFAGTNQIEYVGLFGDEHVWHWQRSAAQASAVESVGRGR